MHVLNPIEYLDSENIEYSLIPHVTSFTAQDTAQKTHIKGKNLSKVVVVSSQDKLLMVVIPANCILVQHSLARLLRSPKVTILPEYKFRDRFPQCETGAMPPFGNLYGMDVLIAEELVQKDKITFNGGTHDLLINMKTDDFIRITGARTINEGYKIASLAQPIISRRKDQWHWT